MKKTNNNFNQEPRGKSQVKKYSKRTDAKARERQRHDRESFSPKERGFSKRDRVRSKEQLRNSF